jgi:hypothetical protein
LLRSAYDVERAKGAHYLPAFFIDGHGRKQFRSLGKYARRGMADILAAKRGLAFFIEVKSETGRLSPDQQEFARGVVLAGATYFVARSIDDVQKHGL